ncbi:hydroxyacylglutathione hydrolase [Clostridium tepidiprofundi DSM 19306]|uniref:Hydroxyacylglutathione hydrolase n=1 Tax=Clostridium tepidiprofundi DSM 19306 TaxID=1121338 RepID=A0A151B314_9CLOT|nr:MBL fold metallo-hydrolase [Clostridium tepidiprofundi]KYH34286.1 hydroxyacylglutathione hydrolase [Clostridium tepidiprofundi DSM 19306]
MELENIKGRTHIIKASTNIGVYVFDNKKCILIDTGLSKNYGKRIDRVLKKENIEPKYIINTHHHIDHSGGNQYFCDNYEKALVCVSEKTSTHLKYPYIGTAVICCGSPISKFEDNKYHKVDMILEPGIHKFRENNGIHKFYEHEFNIISLEGHSEDQIGIITPDNVCFLGDSIFGSEVLKKYSFPYLYDVKKSIESLEYIKNIDADYFVISHSKDVLNREEILELADENIKNINNYIEQILEFLHEPMTREELLAKIMYTNGLSFNFKQYYFNFSTLASFISYLYNEGLIKHLLKDEKLYLCL